MNEPMYPGVLKSLALDRHTIVTVCQLLSEGYDQKRYGHEWRRCIALLFQFADNKYFDIEEDEPFDEAFQKLGPVNTVTFLHDKILRRALSFASGQVFPQWTTRQAVNHIVHTLGLITLEKKVETTQVNRFFVIAYDQLSW